MHRTAMNSVENADFGQKKQLPREQGFTFEYEYQDFKHEVYDRPVVLEEQDGLGQRKLLEAAMTPPGVN